MDIFLRAKHWQLFLVTFGLPILFEIIMMANIFSNLANNHNPLVIVNYFKFFPFLMLLFAGTLFGWQWAVATGFQKMIPASIKMKVKKFKIFFFIPTIYLILIFILMAVVFSATFLKDNPPGPAFVIVFMLIFPIHLFAMFCIFYSLYFLAKTLKTAELQREVTFSDFAGEFFLAWFFPIGVWILQPRINKMIEQFTEESSGLS
ncbi:MAG: hypothetical protein JWQ63_2824 [Mucilaginibacter sp.]|nr:hypothetical protein [Mucilaginibacter sp.]